MSVEDQTPIDDDPFDYVTNDGTAPRTGHLHQIAHELGALEFTSRVVWWSDVGGVCVYTDDLNALIDELDIDEVDAEVIDDFRDYGVLIT